MPNLGFENKNIVMGPGDILYARRGATHATVTPLVAPAPTTASFAVAAADAAKLRVGDVLQLTSVTTPAFTANEASTAPRVTAITASGSDFVVTVSPAFGAAPGTGTATVRVLYKNLGGTSGGIRIEAQVSRNPQYIDQSPYPVAAPVDKIDAKFVAPLTESLGSHFALALGILPGSDESVLQLGASPDTSREDRILAVIPAENGKNRFVVGHRCVSDGQAALTASKTDMGLIELNLMMMPDTAFGAHALFDMKTA